MTTGWYKTGTINVTSGDEEIVGIGTGWSTGVFAGDMFTTDFSNFYEVETVTDDVNITLDRAYGQATASNITYVIIPTSPARSQTTNLVAQFGQMLAEYQEVISAAGNDKLALFNKNSTAAKNGMILRTDDDYMFRVGSFGSDDFEIGYSPTGSDSWSTALNVKAGTGEVYGSIQMANVANVINMTTATPPVSPDDGDTYLIAASPTGAWAGKVGKIARWHATRAEWLFYTPQNAQIVFNVTTGGYYKYDGASFSAFGFITTGDIATFTNKTIDADLNTISNLRLSMFAADVADTDGTMAANSDLRVATQKAVKTYVASYIGASPTITTPTINGGAINGLMTLSLANAGTGAYDVTLAHNGTLTAARALTLNLNDGNRTVSLSGNFTTTDNVTLTAAGGGSAVILPATGTLATLAGTETLSGKSVDAASNTITNLDTTMFAAGIISTDGTFASATDLLIYSGLATKTYINAQISALVAAAPGLLDTLDEIAAALGDDPNFASTMTTALGNRLRVDVNNQGLNGTQQSYGRINLGVVIGTDVQAYHADLAALSGAGFTGTGATVRDTAPTISGLLTAGSLALGGAAISTNAFAVTGTATISGSLALGGATPGSDMLAVTGSAAISGAIVSTGRISTTLTTEQMRLNYSSSFYSTFTVGSAGALTVAAVGGGSATVNFNAASSSTTSAITFTTNGSSRFIMGSSTFSGTGANSGGINYSSASATNPGLLPDRNTTATGFGRAASNSPNVIISGTAVGLWTATGYQGAIGATTPNTGAFTVLSCTSGTLAGLTALAIRNAGTGAFDLTLAHNGTLTAAHTLTINVNDASRALTLTGNLVMSGAYNLTLTQTGTTNVTLPTTGTLATLAGTETFTGKTIDASLNTISNITTAMFAANVVDTDTTLGMNSDTRLPSQAAVKAYIDATNQGIKWKSPVVVVATGSIAPLTGEKTIDGITTSNSRVLVTADTTDNGIWITGAGSWTRATDADTGTELVGASTLVTQGTLNSNSVWNCNNTAITLGVTNITWVKTTSASSTVIYGATTFTATTAQSTYTVAYTPDFLHVYLRGLKLVPAQYTATDGSTVVLETGVASTVVAGDKVEVVVWYTLIPTAANYITTVTFADSGTWTSTGIQNLTRLGVGMTATNAVDVTLTQNAASIIKILNTNASTASREGFVAANGTSSLSLYQMGTGFTPSGMLRADGAYLGAGGAGGLTLNTEANQPIYFGINGTSIGSMTSTGLNGMNIGVTTPGTGAFTTLSATGASSGSTVSTFTAYDTVTTTMALWKRSDAAVSASMIYVGTGSMKLGTNTAHDFELMRGGTVVATLTSTGINSTNIGATTRGTGAFSSISVGQTFPGHAGMAGWFHGGTANKNLAVGYSSGSGNVYLSALNDAANAYATLEIGSANWNINGAGVGVITTLGIGMAPSNILDITQNQNATSSVSILNNNASAAAFSRFYSSNGTNFTYMGTLGTGYTTNAAFVANRGLVASSDTLVVCAATNSIIFASGGIAEKMRLDASGNLGIGMTPTNILDITKTQDADSWIGILNSSAGVSARAGLKLDNGTSQGYFYQLGASYTTSGIRRQDGTLLQGGGAGGLTFNTAVSQPIYFGVNNTERGRFDTNGYLLLGYTSSQGAYKLQVSGGIYGSLYGGVDALGSTVKAGSHYTERGTTATGGGYVTLGSVAYNYSIVECSYGTLQSGFAHVIYAMGIPTIVWQSYINTGVEFQISGTSIQARVRSLAAGTLYWSITGLG